MANRVELKSPGSLIQVASCREINDSVG